MMIHLKILSFTILYLLAIFCFKVYLWLFSNLEYIDYLLRPDEIDDVVDFIIVGCGTAGSLIAHRLSAHKNIKFIVLEAGGSGGPLLNPPSLGPLLQGSIHDWEYETVPQENACHAMKGNKCKWPMGKVVGGSAKLNNMIYTRGYADEIISWFDGKYDIEYINSKLDSLEDLDLVIDALKFKTDLAGEILNAANELGFGVTNLNNGTKTGFMQTVVNQKNGARWSTSHAFLHHHLQNGKLITNALVEKILFDDDIANGVIYEKYGKSFKIAAKKGVILTSGAIGTPKLLLLSGIGPEDDLNALDINIVHNLPVGKNLIDHVTTGLDLIVLNTSLNLNLQSHINPINAWNYFINGNGPWTSPGCEAIAILNTCENELKSTNRAYDDCTLPDVQFMILPVGITSDHGAYLHRAIDVKDSVWFDYFDKIKDQQSITILPIVLHPKSIGYVKLQSKNPSEMPLINPMYFSNSFDVDVIVKGIEIIKKLMRTKSMAKLGAQINPYIFPGCENVPFDSYAYWECYVKHLTLTSYHPAGTCKLGDPRDRSSVVDFNFKVIGVNNLFIADASIFPNLPSGNINTAVALVADLFVDELLQQEK